MKKDNPLQSVHRFTDNTQMKFRPLHFESQQNGQHPREGFANKVSTILGGLFKGDQNIPIKGKQEANRSFIQPPSNQKRLSKNKSTIIERNFSSINSNSLDDSGQEGKSLSRIGSIGQILPELQDDQNLCFLEKVSSDTYLLGNQHQIDLISIAGIYENKVDTDLNWSFHLQKKMKRIAVDPRRMFLAIEVAEEIQIYKYDLKKIKTEPQYINRIKVAGHVSFLLFLKDAIFGVFYPSHLLIYQIEDNNNIKTIFNKKYGISDSMVLMQVPKPIENILNIFFKEKSPTAPIHTLWRLQFDMRAISPKTNFKSLMRIYDIPNRLLKELIINNYTKDTFIMNFKFEILAAKDGYIMDSANINIEDDQSCLIHHGDHLLLISNLKLELYKFRIATNVKPHKIIVNSVDSVEIKKDSSYKFMNCLQMLNGNFVLFYQIKPQYNKKTKGEIDYLFTVTQKLTVSQKLDEIFTFKSPQQLRDIAENHYSIIENKCDIAFKIGLSRKEVFLELWNKSGKSTVDDFKFLLDTFDYETIKQEIEKKLKKACMTFREVYKLEQYCFQMLKKEVYGVNCRESSIKNYIKSHFFLRKLEFFRDFQVLTRGSFDEDDDSEKKSLTIDIQQYFNCFNSELKSYFLEHAFKLINEDKEEEQMNILRYFMKAFRFPLRVIYLTLLENLILQSKNKLIKFLKYIPEILPYDNPEISEGAQKSLYLGLWCPIQPQEWTKNLHMEQITTIYNKECLQDLIKTVWFKRNQYSIHDLINLPKQKIQEIQLFNASDNVFYFFIEKIFEYCPKDQEEVVAFLETNYEKLPQHLKGRIFLYRRLFDYFVAEKWSSPAISSFNAFLKMQDFQLFRQLFKYEKIKKGCLLKDAKYIYSQLPDGNQIYNESLLRYFTSDLSEISDLKCILNRLNNEKRQFHMENQGIYQVLVKGMQTKLKLGSSYDIPLEEVMIYVQNIPLTKNNPIIQQLKTIQRINEEAERFKSIKINLSFLEIIEKQEYVISALLDEEIRKKNVMNLRDEEEFILATYEILAEIQIVKQKIYKDQFRDLEYFLYLNKLLERKEMIHFAKQVLENPHLAQQYVVDDIIVENLILYMYKWRLEDQNYVDHEDYILQLMTILPEDNSIRKYIEAETQFAVMLSSPEFPVQYPLAISEDENSTLVTIKLSEIQSLFKNLDANFITELDLQQLHVLIKEMELFYQEEIIKIEDIYQIVIKRMLQLKDVKKAIPYIRKLIQLRGDSENYSVVFCYLILDIIMGEIATETHKRTFAMIAFHTYSKPLELLDIIERRLNSVFSTTEQQEFFSSSLKKVQDTRIYNPENILLDKDLVEKVKQKEQRYKVQFQDLIYHTWDQVTSSRQDFSKFEYTCIFIFLLHNPYAFAKYISVNNENINIRIIRSYLSYVFKQQIFNRINILKFAKRAFIIALENLFTQLTVEYITSQYTGVSLDDEEVQLDEKPQSALESKLVKSIKAFTKKIDTIKLKIQPVEEESAKKKRIEKLLNRQLSNQIQQSQYPFSDSDDNYESPEEDPNQIDLKSSKKMDKKPLRQGKNLALFLSNAGGEDQQLRRTSPRLLKTSLTFHNQFQSVHFSKREKRRKRSDFGGEGGVDLGIMRTESVGGQQGEEDFCIEDVSKSQRVQPQQPKKDTMEQDMMYISLEEKRLKKKKSEQQSKMVTNSLNPLNWGVNTFPMAHHHKSQGDLSNSGLSDSNTPTKSPKNIMKQDSQIKMMIEDEELPEALNLRFGVTQSIEMPEINFKVNIQEINDEDYTTPSDLAKQLLEDFDSNEDSPIFNLALIQAEKDKDFGSFEIYLKKLVTQVYENSGKPLSIILELIKSINENFPEAQIQADFLKIYIALENYNTKYKYGLPIREMFPIDGIFLKSTDIKVLFKHVKDQILSYVDFEKLMVVAKVIHFSFQKSDIKDELYFSYLENVIREYGNDNLSSEEELGMEKQRIGGIIDQIILVNIFVERGADLLKQMSISERRVEIASLITEALKKKKKQALIGSFQNAIKHLL